MPPDYPDASAFKYHAQEFDRLTGLARLADRSRFDAEGLSGLERLADASRFDAEGLKAQAMIAVDLARIDLEGIWAHATSDYTLRRTPPESWAPQDPADSLYRQARQSLSRDAYRDAANLFHRIRERYPKSVYLPNALFWEAFALDRIGGQNDLREAQGILAIAIKQYPNASTHADAVALNTRIDGSLARNGDRVAAQNLYGRATGEGLATRSGSSASASSDGCPRQGDDERVDALNALVQVDAERAIPILKKVLARREPCTQNMRRTAVWLIASRKAPDAADVLMNVARNDPDGDVREQAVFWLANVHTDEAAGMLIDLARGNGELDLRKRAVYALSRSRSAKAATALREIVLDANAPVELRGDALSWYAASNKLGNVHRLTTGEALSTEDPMIFLKEVYGKADDQRFRERVISTIAQIKTDASRDFLFQIAQNQKESLDTRRTVVGMFVSMNVTGAQIAALYEKNTEFDMKRQLLSSLGSLSSRSRSGQNSSSSTGTASDDGVDQLLAIARAEKNIELRKQAISQLSRSKDPRALALLQEIIER